MQQKQKPHLEPLKDPLEGHRARHPAFGEISVGKLQLSEGIELFGSNLSHKSVVELTLSTAYIDRHLSRDWVHSDRQVVSLYMSEAQWAALMSSRAGAGVPITYATRQSEDAQLERIPGIESTETMAEQFKREVAENCQKYLATASKLMERIEQAMEDGKANKGSLKEMLELARLLNVGMPNSMSFVQKQMASAMEDLVATGKIEIEAYVNDMAVRTGIEVLKSQSPTLIDQHLGSAPKINRDGE